MAIRIKNLDHATAGMKGYASVSLGDITATQEKAVFVAPVACVVDYIDIYSGQAVTGTTACSSMMIRAQLSDISGSQLQLRGTSATASTSNDIVANAQYRLIPSANNSLSTGRVIELNFSQNGSAVLSAVICAVTFTRLIHRETR